MDKYERSSIINIGNRYQIELPFKQEKLNLANNYQYVFNRMLKLEHRLKKNDELHVNYFKFIGDLFGNDHAIVVNLSEAERYGKIWYQSHFCVNSSKKFRVVFDCSTKFKGVCVNDFFV